jgi:hypothetical protein
VERGLPHLLVVAAVTMGIAHTVAKERLFAPLRHRLGGKETWLGFLFSCPYCLSHWIAFALVPLTDAYYVDVVPAAGALAPFLRWFLSAILVTVVAAFLRVGFYFVDETQGLLRRRQVEVEEETATQRAIRSRVERQAEAERRTGPDGPGRS